MTSARGHPQLNKLSAKPALAKACASHARFLAAGDQFKSVSLDRLIVTTPLACGLPPLIAAPIVKLRLFLDATICPGRCAMFDKEYMQSLFAYGYQKGRSGYPWQKAPPGYVN
jgi:hypothetical protein